MFIKNTLGSDNLDGREISCKITGKNRKHYIMNSGISGIDEADC